MRLLVIGGTVFLGRAVVEAAMARGDEVTIFHRGVHGHGYDVETIVGDRRVDMDRLSGRSWDAVVDTCGFAPADIAAIGTERYVFVSTAGVYRDWPVAAVHEDSPLHQAGEDYSALKAATERAAEAAMPGRVAHVRPGVIVGPHENIGRLPYWLERVARGGRVLAPERADSPIQLIDARDLATFLLDAEPGAYNAVSRPGAWTWGELLQTVRAEVNPDAELVWTPAGRVLAEVPDPWGVLPLWPAPLDDMVEVYGVGVERALAAGLRIRPLRETVLDTWSWLSCGGGDRGDWRAELQVQGLDPGREQALLDG